VIAGQVRTQKQECPLLALSGHLLFAWLAGYVLVYTVFVSFGVYYIYKLLREGPTSEAKAIPGATGSRPMAFADSATATGGQVIAER
jgi:cytochrome bd ubiquinol oxidase subunit I